MTNQLFHNREELLASIANGTTPAVEGVRLLNSLKPAPIISLKPSRCDKEKAVNSTKTIPWFQLRILS